MSSAAEKGEVAASGSDKDAYVPNTTAVHGTPDTPRARTQEDFLTRNGLNLKSFQKREYGAELVHLDQSMKKRHLHMIAIGMHYSHYRVKWTRHPRDTNKVQVARLVLVSSLVQVVHSPVVALLQCSLISRSSVS